MTLVSLLLQCYSVTTLCNSVVNKFLSCFLLINHWWVIFKSYIWISFSVDKLIAYKGQ